MKLIESEKPADFLLLSQETFLTYKTMAEKAIAQLSEAECYLQAETESNSVAILMKHISGNLRSRFSDFLTTDGEKPDRFRDSEFEIEEQNLALLQKNWEQAFQILFQTLAELSEADLVKTIFIRQKPHSVMQAIFRSMAHISYHVGQIVQLAKSIKGENWQTLSIAKGKSELYNQELNSQK